MSDQLTNTVFLIIVGGAIVGCIFIAVKDWFNKNKDH